jgi:uncharacterized protein
MNQKLRNRLIKIAEQRISNTDVSHDFEHALRVLANAERIAKEENGDFDIVVPAALFHDLIVYQKNHPNKHKSQEESADVTEQILNELGNFPKEKIAKVKTCILECSFSKRIVPELLESKIIQDADGLEATGAISIMRTYSTTGQIKRPFYNSKDPFCENRGPNAPHYALDLFYERLLKVGDRMHTKMAKKMAKKKNKVFIRFFERIQT